MCFRDKSTKSWAINSIFSTYLGSKLSQWKQAKLANLQRFAPEQCKQRYTYTNYYVSTPAVISCFNLNTAGFTLFVLPLEIFRKSTLPIQLIKNYRNETLVKNYLTCNRSFLISWIKFCAARIILEFKLVLSTQWYSLLQIIKTY